MKDSRFIELLNLYVDREITPAEAAELEAEVHRSAERRGVFTQYGRMDRACTLVLSRNGAAPAPTLAAALADADRKVVGFPAQADGRFKLVFFGGLMAAAAAVAIVFVNRDAASVRSPSQSTMQAQPQVAVVLQPAPVPTGREAVVALPFGDRPVPTAATVRPAFAWMKGMELSRTTPLSDEDVLLVARTEKSFSSGLTWGLRREYATFPKTGVTRSPSEINAFELRK